MSEKLINQMVDRFLCWKLPADFAPDCGISFDGRKDDEWNKNKTWPVGTNLLTAEQAKQMFMDVMPTDSEFLRLEDLVNMLREENAFVNDMLENAHNRSRLLEQRLESLVPSPQSPVPALCP